MNTKKIICLLLSVLMLASLLGPIGAFADDGIEVIDDFSDDADIVEVFDDNDQDIPDENDGIVDDDEIGEIPDEPQDDNAGEPDDSGDDTFGSDDEQPDDTFVDDSEPFDEEEIEDEDEEIVSAATVLTITKQPEDITAAAGSSVTWTVTASSTNVNYQWQYYYNSKWNNFVGGDSATLTKTAAAAWNGWKIRVIVTDKNDASNTVTSNEVTLSVLAITKQPAAQTVAAGAEAPRIVNESSTHVN